MNCSRIDEVVELKFGCPLTKWIIWARNVKHLHGDRQVTVVYNDRDRERINLGNEK